MAKKAKNYINNKDFYEALVKHRTKRLKWEEDGKNGESPIMSDYIGKCFIQLSKKIASRGNFSSYTYKDEMIDDGIENCVIAINSFNPEKYDNPFSYFTTIIWFAFLRRIDKEKKQSYIKHMNLVNASMNALVDGGHETFPIDDYKAASYVERFEKKKKDAIDKKLAKIIEEVEEEVIYESETNTDI